MCIINSKDARVSATRIFILANGKSQLTIYSNAVNTSDAKATMILPVPFPSSLVFYDVKAYPNLFEDIEFPFKPPPSRSLGRGVANILPIFSVGSYNVSVASSLSDFDRADASFELLPDVRDLFSDYASTFGFIICKLRVGESTYSPLAYSHDLLQDEVASYFISTPSTSSVFVPTLHYHGHGKEIIADWDHTIYLANCKLKDWITLPSQLKGFSSEKRFPLNLSRFVPIGTGDSSILNTLIRSVQKLTIEGRHRNRDIFASCL